MKSIARSIVLVALTMAWHQAADWISDRIHNDTDTFASPWKIPMFLLGTLITCGLIVGLGIVKWGKTSLRDLGWTSKNIGVAIAVGLIQSAVIIAAIGGVYFAMGGMEGLREYGHAIVSLTIAQRVFFTVAGIRNAFFEETLFRGDLSKAIEVRFGAIAAVVLSSAVFALHHRTLSPISLGMKFAMGAIWALSAIRMKTLVPSALSHALTWAIVANA